MSTPNQPAGPGFAAATQAYALLTLQGLFAGFAVVASKASVGNVDPFALVTLRWIGAVLVILPFAWRYLRADWPAIRSHWWLFLFYGAVGYATTNILTYIAVVYTSGVNNALDQVATNIFVLVGNLIIFRTRVRALQLFGVVITVIGVALVVSHGDLQRILALEVNFGDALTILGCLCYAIYSITLRLRPRTHLTTMLLANFSGALFASLVFAVAFGGGLERVTSAVAAITPLGWAIVAFFVFIGSAASQFLYARSVELIGANRASLFLNLVPFFGAILSVLVLFEPVEPFHLIAGALLIAGIVISEWSARRQIG